MDPWVWLVAYLVGFTLLQLLLYRRFRQDVPQGEATPGGAESPVRRTRAGGDSSGGDAVTCRRCGTANESEPTFTFCRQCCGPLH